MELRDKSLIRKANNETIDQVVVTAFPTMFYKVYVIYGGAPGGIMRKRRGDLSFKEQLPLNYFLCRQYTLVQKQTLQTTDLHETQ